jgi:hypothetical protein
LGPEVEAALKALALAEPSARFTQDVLGRLDRPAPRGFPLDWQPALAAASALIVLATGWWILVDRRAVSPASGVPAAVSSPAGSNARSSRADVAGPGAGGPAAGPTAQLARQAGRDAGPPRLAGRAPVDASTDWAADAARGAEDALAIAPIDPLSDIVLDAVTIMEIDLGPLDVPPLMLPSIDEIDEPVQSPGR